MPFTDWRLDTEAQTLYVSFPETISAIEQLAVFQEIAELARGQAVRALIVEPRPLDTGAAPVSLADHEAVAGVIAEIGVSVFVLVAARATGDARHLVFAVQRRGLTARRAAGRQGAFALARRLLKAPPRRR
ncbi:MAG: hypothetical protein ACFE0P_10805 [Oceanicaulis sp.]